MRLTQNLSTGMRWFYALSGVALIAGPFILALEGFWKWLLPLVGIVAILEGLVGW